MNAPESIFLPDVQASPDVRIARWKVASENFESIHNHSAYAELWGENR